MERWRCRMQSLAQEHGYPAWWIEDAGEYVLLVRVTRGASSSVEVARNMRELLRVLGW